MVEDPRTLQILTYNPLTANGETGSERDRLNPRSSAPITVSPSAHLANKAREGTEGAQGAWGPKGGCACTSVWEFCPKSEFFRVSLGGAGVRAGSGCNLFLQHLELQVWGLGNFFFFCPLRLFDSNRSLSGRGPSPAPSRPGKWRSGERVRVSKHLSLWDTPQTAG